MEPALRVDVLGPLQVWRDGARVEPTSPKQRAVLIDLVLHAGEIVSRDRLIDDLWGDQPPASAAGTVQNYISQLRRALGGDVVLTAGPGYGIAP
jgi:DNA-binding SARP family transcriptional activator